MFFRAATACVFSICAALPVLAQGAPQFSAISAAKVAALMEGKDSGLAQVADAHGWPSPDAVVAHAVELNLAPDQILIATKIKSDLERDARDIGRAYLAVEAELEETFRSGRASPGNVQALAKRSGELRAQLRALQLSAHIKMRPNLTRAQLEIFSRLPDVAASRTGG
ncbi:MAG: hypothetical protein ACI9ZM_001501 [Paracoccaceae bacterium]|jgi:hypothetical protein